VEKLFETFYTTKTNGLGVGLSICPSIVASQDGCIWAEANDGPGATDGEVGAQGQTFTKQISF
jgi:C4-dicarboxylate-specific signal transduction histidine kinase